MTDLDTLRDAFTELERRADAHATDVVAVRPAPASATSRRRLVLVAATVVALLTGVTGVVLVARHGDTPTTLGPAGTDVTASALVDPSPTGSPTPSVSPTPTGGAGAPPVLVATTAAELTDRFRAALAGVATFSVTSSNVSTPVAGEQDPHDVLLAGVLTTASGSGGYDVQTLQGTTGPAQCAEDFQCVVTARPDGSSLAVGTTSVSGTDGSAAGGVTYEISLVRPDGVLVLLHVSNEQDPKGGTANVSDQPPLTVAQATAVVSSAAWVTTGS